MTERDWVDLIEKDRRTQNPSILNVDDLQWKLLGWADWAEEQGLGCDRGLRLLANYKHGPRYPWPSDISKREITNWVWFPTEMWHYQSTSPTEINGILYTYKPQYNTIGPAWTSVLDAVKAAALAMQEVFPE